MLTRRAWKSCLQSKDRDHPLACLSPGQNPDSAHACQEWRAALVLKGHCSPSESQVLSPQLTGGKAGGAALEERSGWNMGVNTETCGCGGPCTVATYGILLPFGILELVA